MNGRSTGRFCALSSWFMAAAVGVGCAGKPTAPAPMATVPPELLQISQHIQKNFVYRNFGDRRSLKWPPHVDARGRVLGNCMTYSRIVQSELEPLGFKVRFRNVLAPVFPREHVVTAVTDHQGRDWVFDNRHTHPFPLSELSLYYEFEPAHQLRYIGAQRYQWRTLKALNAPSG